MEYKIEFDELPDNEDVARCLKTLFETAAGTQPALRDFGIDRSFLDQIPEVAESMFVLEVKRKVKKYEPRVSIKKINFEYKEEKMIPHILFGKGEEKL